MMQQAGEKMAGTGIHALRSNTAVCHNRNNPLVNCSQVHCGLLSPALHAARSDLWQSALKFRLLTVGIRSTGILFVAIRSI
jgi:hypothetical protein